jgi:hypothetical protein
MVLETFFNTTSSAETTTKKRSRSSDKKTPAEVVLADCLEPFVTFGKGDGLTIRLKSDI